MKRFIFSVLSALIVGGGMTMAQNVKTVKGRVLASSSNRPVEGAMVSVEGVKGYSTLTDENGCYELKVPDYASSLFISAPGYNSVKSGLSSGLQQRDARLHSETFTDDYEPSANVRGDKQASGFSLSHAVSVEEEIQQRLGSGVRTIQRNGTSGIGGVMLINGLNSLNVNAQPLIVIDGVIIDQQYGRTMLHDGFYNNILSNVSVSDIEKVTVMRNATALYGSKGANGVILINTRRSRSMATRITASLSAGVTLEPKYIDMMDATQYKSYASDLLSTTNTTLMSFKFLNNDPTYYYYPQYHNNTDWKDKVYRTAFTQNYNINVEGGDDVASYNLSLGYMDNQSVLECNDMNRINIRFNSDIQLLKWFSVRFDASFANQVRNLRNDGAPIDFNEGTPTSPAFLAYAKSPMLSPYSYANGQLSDSYLDISDENYLDEALSKYSNYNYKLANPLAINEYGEAENKNHFENSMVNIAITPKFVFNSHLTLTEHFSYNLVNTNEKYYIPTSGVPDYYVSSIGDVRENEARSLFSKQNSVMSDTRLDWHSRYGGHEISLFGGARVNWESYTMNSQLGYNTGNDKTPFITTNLLNVKTAGLQDDWTTISWYAQAGYSYLGRYFLQANLTADASSRFGADADHALKAFDTSWGIFPAVQASWVVSNEPWMADLGVLDYLKLSAGYDVSGNDDIDNYASRSYFQTVKFLQSVSGISLGNIGNNHLKWETTKKWNIGIETSLLDNRLHLAFDYFNSKTTDLLTFQSLGYLSGIEKNWSNSGELKNSGFDASLSGKLLSTRDWQWELGATVGHYKNEITALPDNQSYIDTEAYGATIRTEIGKAANLFYGYRTEGVFATSEKAAQSGLYILDDNGVTRHPFTAGDVIFADLDGDHAITAADREVIGDPNPDIYGNLFTSVAWKRFKLDVNFNYSLGNDVFNYMRQQLESGSRFMNQTVAMTRRWQNEGQSTSVPKATFQDPMGNSRFSDRWIEDGSYLRLKTVTLSYTLPVNSSFLQGLQFWLQGNNLPTFSKYLGSDPEFSAVSTVIGQGIDLGQLPQSRSIVAGIKINL